jgi:hypothetical protein
MAKKQSTPEQIIGKLREAEVLVGQRKTVAQASKQIGLKVPTAADCPYRHTLHCNSWACDTLSASLTEPVSMDRLPSHDGGRRHTVPLRGSRRSDAAVPPVGHRFERRASDQPLGQVVGSEATSRDCRRQHHGRTSVGDVGK